MGLSTKIGKALGHDKFFKALGLKPKSWGDIVTRPWRKFLTGSAHSASSYQTLNNAYGVANDYKLDTRYRSLAELTGTK